MIPIHGKPLLEYIINGLVFAGFKNLIIVVGYRKDQIMDYFQNGERWGVRIEYKEQKEINGTGGALLICEDSIKDDHFFLAWGDVLVSFNIYKEVIEVFKNENQDYILVANYTDDPFKGAAVYCENNSCIGIVEKPPEGKSKSNLNNGGIFIFSKEIFQVLKQIKPSKRGEIELTDAINYGIVKRKWKIRVLQTKFRGDFGDKQVYEQLIKETNWLKELNSSDS